MSFFIVQLEYALLFSLPREGTLQRALGCKVIESSVSWFKRLPLASLQEAKFPHEKQIPKYNAFCDKLVLCMICKMFLKLQNGDCLTKREPLSLVEVDSLLF